MTLVFQERASKRNLDPYTQYCVKLQQEEANMASNLAINDTLLNAAFEIGGYSSKKETVNTALQEFIQRRKSEELIQLFGTIEYDADYDYKKLRAREQK